MPIRDFLLIALVAGVIPLCIARPYIGVLVWSWIGYMNPHRLTWGPSYDLPFAQVVAIATLVGLVGLTIREGRLPKIPLERETVLLGLLWAMYLLTTLVALRPDLAWPELTKISKILVMTFLTIMLINSERKLRYLLLVIALSLGFYGIKGGLFSVLTGGQHMVWGPSGSFIGDNTALGLAMNMVLPMLYYLPKTESNRWLKWLLRLTFALTVLAVLFTYSRGAFLGLVVVLGFLFLDLRMKTKIVAAILAIVLIPVGLSVIPAKWVSRVESIKTYDQDRSALSRIHAWKTAWRVAVDRPLTGGGFQIVNDPEAYERYFPSAILRTGVHSIYFEVLAENGFITFVIFVLLLISSIASMRKTRRVARDTERTHYYYYSKMLAISLLSYLVSGIFLEMASFDLFYHVIALMIVVKALMRQDMQRTGKQLEDSQPGSASVAVQSP